MGKDNLQATPLTEEQLNQKEADLNIESEKLAEERKVFDAEKEAFNKDAEKLAEERKAFDAEKEAFNKDAEKLAEEKKAFDAEKEVFSATEKQELVPGLDFTFEKKNYKFSDDAPKTIRLNGESKTQKEITDSKELTLLVLGFGLKSGLIKKTQ